MTLEQECALSYTVSGHLYVKKLLKIYDYEVYIYLRDHHISDTPYIYELIETDEGLYVIEEYLSGETLEDILKKGPIEEERAVSVIRQLCTILDSFHNSPLHIVHRDIKPSNIMISPDGHVKLLDMNAAKVIDKNAVQDTNLIGTFHYAAPEQFGFSPSDARTDIYAQGVLLNKMLTGHFPNEQLAEGRLRQVICKCTMMDPEMRFSSVRDLMFSVGTFPGPEDSTRLFEQINKEKEEPEGGNGKIIRYYLPLGFRTLRPGCMVIASLLYALFIIASLSVSVRNADAVEVWLNRIGLMISFLMSFMVCTNWLHMWGWTKDKIWLRVILTVAAVFLILLFTVAVITEITESL